MEEYYTPNYIENPCSSLILCRGFKAEGIKVYVTDDEYKICADRSFKRWANEKKGKYGSGILNTSKDDPRKVERIGLLGEMAFGKIFQLPVDIGYRKGGDQYDFLIKGQRIDVKTNSYLNKQNPAAFIYAYDNEFCHQYGRCKANIMEAHVLAYLEEENRDDQTAVIVFAGYVVGRWITKNMEFLLKPSRKQDKEHINIEIPYTKASSIFTLLDWALTNPVTKKSA